MSGKRGTDQGQHIMMLRNRARQWDSEPSRSQIRRMAIVEEDMHMTDPSEIDFWEEGDFKSLDDIPEPTEEDIRDIEQEEYQPTNENYLDDLPVVPYREEDFYSERDRYEDY